MRGLIGCETSGVVRRAFAALGHDVWSCDLLPAEDGSNRHIRDDIRNVLNDGWDFLAVMHPPCTRLCRSGRHWMSGPGKWTPPKQLPKGRSWDSMRAEFEEGVALFVACWRAPIERVAIENPEMNDLARDRMPADLTPPHIVQPWWFGDPAFKATGLYLKNLEPLEPTNMLTPPKPGTAEHKAWSQVHRASPGPDRWKIRSRTYQGIANAMAWQWGGDVREHGELFA
ncbi:hypothetical protein [Bradyrhizobium sp. 5.13L]